MFCLHDSCGSAVVSDCANPSGPRNKPPLSELTGNASAHRPFNPIGPEKETIGRRVDSISAIRASRRWWRPAPCRLPADAVLLQRGRAASGEHSCTGRRSTLTGRHNRTRKCLLLLLSCLTERKAFTGISHLLAYILLTQRSKGREDLICRRESAIAVVSSEKGEKEKGVTASAHTHSLSLPVHLRRWSSHQSKSPSPGRGPSAPPSQASLSLCSMLKPACGNARQLHHMSFFVPTLSSTP
ncbi:hypothetical protein CTAM01_03432 [Colletotrichum tamarilloi]|uniref:Uncharacterized protein n=1 Tax=Colletotrichum tamarilloi TaxID=1209934 RepID=A0ABQ9RK54_9PEZI|nr:uncharacterized protein CTAM01_03432 [Colletotrichum tamarilloi]KAK1506097.1 hypothetical protein CTAM01_03432 [Colletotrichum tamarilloi]